MKNLKIWVKMAAGLGTIILLIVILSVLSSRLLKQVDKETEALRDEYLPLRNIATQLNGNILRVPALMNDYLLTGKKESYAQLEGVFQTVGRDFSDMDALLAKYPSLNGGRTAKAKESYDLLEKTIRASHDTNEQFVTLRTKMIKIGENLFNEVESIVAEQDKVQQEAMRTQDLNELIRVAPLVRGVNQIRDQLNIIRMSMMRSLVEQNRSYSKDNLPVRFPALLKTGDSIIKDFRNPTILQIMKKLRAGVEDFRDVQASMEQLRDEQEKLTAARAPAREATLSLMQQVADAADKMQNKAMTQVAEAVDNAIAVTLVICLITLLIAVGVGFGLTRSITGPVSQALRFAQAVAGGRLDQRLGLDRRDEIGQLSTSLDSMVDSLNEKIQDAEKKSREAEEQSQKALKAMEQAEAAKQVSAKQDRGHAGGRRQAGTGGQRGFLGLHPAFRPDRAVRPGRGRVRDPSFRSGHGHERNERHGPGSRQKRGRGLHGLRRDQTEGRGRRAGGEKGRARHRGCAPDVPGSQGGYGPAQRARPGHQPDHGRHLGHRGPDQPAGPERRH